MFLKNKNIIFKIRRSKVTDYAALNKTVSEYFDSSVFFLFTGQTQLNMFFFFNLVDKGREDTNTTKSWPFEWCFASGPMMTKH